SRGVAATGSWDPPDESREAGGGKAQTFVGLYQHFPADRSSPPGTASRDLDGGAGGDARNAGYVRPLPLGSRRGPDAGGECVLFHLAKKRALPALRSVDVFGELPAVETADEGGVHPSAPVI